MSRRPALPAADTAAHRAWITAAIEAPFHLPRQLPRLTRPKAEPESPTPLPDFFEKPEAPAAKPAPVYGTMRADELIRLHFAPVLSPMSPLTLMRQARRRERAEAAAAAAIEEAPALVLTFDMGSTAEAHAKDHLERGEVMCPPFSLFDDCGVPTEIEDEFLGQVVDVEAGRALLFRRRATGIIDGIDVGQRYVLLRFWDDAAGELWLMDVDGEDDDAVRKSAEQTVALYWRSQSKVA